MIEVSKNTFDTFYEDNMGVLNRTPKYNSKENSISWSFQGIKKIACRIVEFKYNSCKFFIDN